jgi:Ca2+:H+ antiporter
MVHSTRTPVWSWFLPLAGLALFVFATEVGFGENFASNPLGIAIAILLVPLLLGAVFAAVYHAEEVAFVTGEPVGTLVLTMAVTVIELALIVSLMLTGKAAPTLVRDTVFSVVMIITTGLVGTCLLVGGIRYREQTFDVMSAKIYLAMLTVLTTLSIILPNYTSSAPGRFYSTSQLAFMSLAIVALYAVFVFTQTVRHRDYFSGDHAPPDPDASSGRKIIISTLFLCIALGAVVLIAKLFAIEVNVGVAAVGAPPGVSGVIIAAIVLLPESIAAVRAACRDDLQKSLNLTLGSSLATIGLTIPAIAVANIILEKPLVLGLDQRDLALVVMTLAASILTFGTGRTNVLFGFLHLVIFGTFLFFAFVP